MRERDRYVPDGIVDAAALSVREIYLNNPKKPRGGP